jgi:hypothetical protein
VASAYGRLPPGSEVIGHAGMQHTTTGDRREVELLWFIHPGTLEPPLRDEILPRLAIATASRYGIRP